MTKDEFIERAATRLASLTGPARDAEAERLEAEMIVHLTAEAETAHKAEVASLEADYIRARRSVEAQQLIARIGRPGCDTLLLPHVLDRIQVTRKGDEWIVTARSATGVETSLDGLAAELRNTPGFEQIVAGASPEEKANHARLVAETLGLPAPAKH